MPAPAIEEKLLLLDCCVVARLILSELQYGHVIFIRYTSLNEKKAYRWISLCFECKRQRKHSIFMLMIYIYDFLGLRLFKALAELPFTKFSHTFQSST